MDRDLKLDQLATAQEQAFRRKQSCYRDQQNSWGLLSLAREKMNRAFELKQATFKEQERVWQEYQLINDRNGPLIDSQNFAQELAFQNMKISFDKGTAAHSRNDGASAKQHSIEGHAHKRESQECVKKRRELVEECKNARSRHEKPRQDFRMAKQTFGRAKNDYENAKILHQRFAEEFKQSKNDLDLSIKAFRARLEELKNENTKRKEESQILVVKADIPYQYRNSIYILNGPEGSVSIYFGGINCPDGLGHGRYDMTSSGKVTYKREPFNPYSGKNFCDYDSLKDHHVYIRNYRSGILPIITGKTEGAVYRMGIKVGISIHYTQVYSDGYRLSWDSGRDGAIDRLQWTDDNLRTEDPNRHIPPLDASIF